MSDETNKPAPSQAVRLVAMDGESVILSESHVQQGARLIKPLYLHQPEPVAIPYASAARNTLERGAKSEKPAGVSAPKPVAVPPTQTVKPTSEKK
jgi:hypothetical protein